MTARTKRRRLIAAVAALAAIAAAVLVLNSRSTPRATAEPPATTTSTTSTSTTTTTAPVDPTLTTVATALGPTVSVLEGPPPGLALDRSETDRAQQVRAIGPAYSPERPDADPLPAAGHAIQGRRKTAVGWEYDSPTPWGQPLTFVVTERHGDWLRVLMPVRPNGVEGWINAADVALTTHRFRVEISLGSRHLQAFDATTMIADTPVVVGRDATPTPTGRFYVTDYEEKRAGSAYGPWILPISAYSQALDWFDGGVPVIAMHGTNRPDLLGSAASNGCIRMPDEVIQRLRDTLPLGTPVLISG